MTKNFTPRKAVATLFGMGALAFLLTNQNVIGIILCGLICHGLLNPDTDSQSEKES